MYSRELGTRNLVAGLRRPSPRPAVLVSSSAIGWYGHRGDEVLDEGAPAADDFLAQVCAAWEREAAEAEELGVRVVRVRTGVVLDKGGGALAKMLPFFKLGGGGPVAGGRQYMSWIHVDDLVAMYLAALDGDAWTRPGQRDRPDPGHQQGVLQGARARAAPPGGGAGPRLRGPALYGEMADIVVHGQRVVPERPQALGFRFAHPELGEALASALAD